MSTPFPAAPRAGWWQRHWRWVVPLLCLFCLTVFAGAVLLFVSALFGMMRSSDVYTTAMHRMRESPQVVESLGTPIKPGWYLSGQINISGASGDASLQIPSSGPNADVDLYAEAEKKAGRWAYSTLIVNIDGQDKQIDLLSERIGTKISK